MKKGNEMSTANKIEKMMLLGHSETVIADLIFAAFEEGEMNRLEMREIMIRFASLHYARGHEDGVDCASHYAEELG